MSDDDAGPRDRRAEAGDANGPLTVEAEMPPPATPRPSPNRPMEITALALGIAAAVSCILALSLWNSAAIGLWVAVGLAIAGAACGVAALERRGHHPAAISAVVIASVAGVVAIAGALPQPDLEAHVYGYAAGPDAPPDDADASECPGLPDVPAGYDADFFYGAMYAADGPPSGTLVLAFDATVTLASTATERTLMTMAAGQPIDVTEAAQSAAVDPPERGRYIAVPVLYSEPTDDLACIQPTWPSTWWATDSGAEIELATVSIPGYPTLEEGGSGTEDSLTYYDIFDVDPEAAASGAFRVVLLNPDLTQQTILWGDAE